MRVLVDTSVWVDYLRQGDRQLSSLLEKDEVFCHPLIVGELACGRLEPRTEILHRLDLLPKTPLVQNSEAIQFIEEHGLWAKGIGFIDIHILASALLGRAEFWTRDKRLRLIALDLRIAFLEG